MGNESESGELVLSPVRAGMKREFARLMKDQVECGIPSGQRRVTRAQNVALSNEQRRVTRSGNSPMKNGLPKSPGKSWDAKKRKKEEKVPVTEEEEPMSDVVDEDEEGKGKLTKKGNQEIPNGGVNNKVEIENSVVKNVVEIESGVAKDGVEVEINVVKEYDSDNVKVMDDCETVNVEVVGMDKQEVELIRASKGVNGVETVNKGGEVSVENRVAEKPFRRFTRSALKQKEEDDAAVSGAGDVKVMEPVKSDALSLITTPAKMEMKMSKKVELKRVPTKLKELLETGLLEGLSVRYVHVSKVKGQSQTELRGEIKGAGILCFCDTCNGNEVVTPNQFELHAGSANKRLLECIYLENGSTLREVLNVCKNAPLDSLDLAIQVAAGCSSSKRSTFCQNCKGPLPEAGTGKTMLLCDSCVDAKESEHTPKQVTGSDRSLLCASDMKSSEQIASSTRKSQSHGRLTRKDQRLHKLVFEEDVLPDGTALAYYVRGKKLIEGYKKGFGIFCYCCETEVSPSQFEAHAGCASRRKPYQYIYTSNGVSLHELSIKLAKERKLSPEENDDLCSICADGGDLVCCDNCPRAFHPECESLPSVPQGNWYCRYCRDMFQREKFVEYNENAVAAGRVAGVDPMEQIIRRCFRIVETLDADLCSCVLCRGNDFSKSAFGPRTVIICDQCEKEYHIGCLKEHNMDDLKELPKGKWFCHVECKGVHSALEKVVADGEMKLPEALLDLIKRKHSGNGSDDCPDLDIRWRLFHGKMVNEDTRKFLSGAVTLLHERFDPIADTNTSRLDLIPQMVYGRSFKDQDLGGMYTAILLINSVVVSVGIFRIFGQELAELPLVATSSDYQGKGYFQCLFSCIENLLESLNVRDLLLPAAEEAEALWINKFNFKKITQEELREFRKDHQMMIFQGTAVLHKSVQKSQVE